MAERLPGADFVTYRRADGELICGEFAFVTDLEYFETDDEPTALIEARYTLVSERTVVMPSPDGRSCAFEVPDTKGDWCEADAVAWVPVDERFEPRCVRHKEGF